MIIFTSICANYLHKARTLAKSVKREIPNSTFVVCLLEKERSSQYEYEYFDEIVLAKDMWDGNFNRFLFKHTIVEASTSVKGHFFQYLYNKFPNDEQFIYLDPDIYVYSDFIELRELLKIRPIVLCPHLLQPGNIDMELSSTAHGVYNLGFLAVNRSPEAQRFINWWAERLYLYCYDEINNGIFTDQKWIDLAPCFFDVEILKHRGYDFAPWSLLDCGMEEQDGQVLIKGDQLRFIHFSGYGATAEKCMNDWLPKGDHAFRRLYRAYSELHDSNDYDSISKTKWSYSTYVSGEKIKSSVRLNYRKDYDLMFSLEDPFQMSNGYFEKQRIEIESNKIVFLTKKSFQIIRQQGIKSFIKKIMKKINAS